GEFATQDVFERAHVRVVDRAQPILDPWVHRRLRRWLQEVALKDDSLHGVVRTQAGRYKELSRTSRPVRTRQPRRPWPARDGKTVLGATRIDPTQRRQVQTQELKNVGDHGFTVLRRLHQVVEQDNAHLFGTEHLQVAAHLFGVEA